MSPSPSRRWRSIALGALFGLVVGVAGVVAAPVGAQDQVTLRLGYFPNVTHATAIVGVESGTFGKALGDGVKLELLTYSTGTQALEAFFSGAIDATYIGPNPAINGYAQSNGKALRIISGATSGGAFLVVKPEINNSKDLKGKTLASPSLGNTQDVALRAWLKKKGFDTDTEGGGDVHIVPQDNALTLEAFRAGDIDGAWVPEPWATRLIDEGGGRVLVDERDLWPGGEYVTTQLIVARQYLQEHKSVVKSLLEGHVDANDYIAQHPDKAEQVVADGIEHITGKAVSLDLIAKTFDNLTFTNDPIASSLRKSAKAAENVGLLDPVDLDGIYGLRLLNKVLAEKGEPKVSAR